ncbi:hypothetical protein C2E23DRAFT_387278 [Lenzites betulinus]|nr:hypothetical protein C2E23DRAFT_387278 [Lenzites betulinus]
MPTGAPPLQITSIRRWSKSSMCGRSGRRRTSTLSCTRTSLTQVFSAEESTDNKQATRDATPLGSSLANPPTGSTCTLRTRINCRYVQIIDYYHSHIPGTWPMQLKQAMLLYDAVEPRYIRVYGTNCPCSRINALGRSCCLYNKGAHNVKVVCSTTNLPVAVTQFTGAYAPQVSLYGSTFITVECSTMGGCIGGFPNDTFGRLKRCPVGGDD